LGFRLGFITRLHGDNHWNVRESVCLHASSSVRCPRRRTHGLVTAYRVERDVAVIWVLLWGCKGIILTNSLSPSPFSYGLVTVDRGAQVSDTPTQSESQTEGRTDSGRCHGPCSLVLHEKNVPIPPLTLHEKNVPIPALPQDLHGPGTERCAWVLSGVHGY
jgi:hypothetical protein